jgi:hypothetical protein
MRFSVTIDGDTMKLHAEHSEQRVGNGDPDMGEQHSLDITIQGFGTDDPVLRLDNWDALYSSCPPQRVTTLSVDTLRENSTEGTVTVGARTARLPRRAVDKPVMTETIRQGLTTELTKDRLPGYRASTAISSRISSAGPSRWTARPTAAAAPTCPRTNSTAAWTPSSTPWAARARPGRWPR